MTAPSTSPSPDSGREERVLVPSPRLGGGSARRAGEGASPIPLASFVVLCIVTAVLSGFAAGPSTLPGDAPIARFIQRWHFVPLQSLANLGNDIGSTATAITVWIALLLSSIALRRNRDALVVFTLGVLRALGSLLKYAFVSPRPTSAVVHLQGYFSGYGYPSGHTYAATCIGGAVLLIARWHVRKTPERWALYVIAVAIPIVTGFARVYVGAHWPSDVLGGWLWGAVTVFVAWWIGEWMMRRVRASRRRVAR